MMRKILNKRVHLFLYLIFLSFSACRLGKEYERPELDLPRQFNNVSFADTSSVADLDLSQFFADPTLMNLIETGLEYNHDLLVAIKRMDIAQQRVNQSRVLMAPDIEVLAIDQTTRPSDNSLTGLSVTNFVGMKHIENYSLGINLSWEADIWGKIRGQKEVILTEYLRTHEAAKAVQTQLVADIALGFFNLLMLDEQLEIARMNLILNDSFLVATRLLKEAGLGSELAVQQAEAQKQGTALLLPRLEQAVSLQENALQILTGRLPGSIPRDVLLDDYLVPEDLSTGLPIAMVSRRPDVRASELELLIANTEVGIAQANMYPALNISAGGGLEAFKASNWFSIPGSLFGTAAGSIAQPVFRRRALKTDYEIAKLEREQKVIQFRQSVLQATGEVSDALVLLDKLEQQERIAAAQVDTLHRTVYNARLLFKSDLANYLEVIIAQRESLASELDRVAIRRQRLDAVVELYRSLGGGWQ